MKTLKEICTLHILFKIRGDAKSNKYNNIKKNIENLI